jgi:hypothetical protein
MELTDLSMEPTDLSLEPTDLSVDATDLLPVHSVLLSDAGAPPRTHVYSLSVRSDS